MNILVMVTITILSYGSLFTEAEVQEVPSKSRASLPPVSNKLNNRYLPPLKQQQDYKPDVKQNVQITDYQHNRPKVIDDPLPMRVDYIQPLDLDFAKNKPKAIFKGAVISGLLFNVYDKQLPAKKKATQQTPTHIILNDDKEKISENKLTNINVKKVTEQDVKAESTFESKKYVQSPTGFDVFPRNYFTNTAFDYQFFNYDDDIKISASAPVVIFKPGDDISFTKDTAVIDDYEHIFSAEDLYENKNLAKEKEILTKDNLNKSKKATSTTTTSNSFLEKTIDYYTGDATNHVPAQQKSESVHTEQGYFYEKPQIPFMF